MIPLTREPETQDASTAQEQEIDLFFDLAMNLFGKPGDQTPNVRARNINTIDEVPDSSWFTNRILARPVTTEEAVRGPLTDDGPAPGTWSITRPKQAGFAPGFTMKDANGTTWFVSFDARGYPEAATGAILVANKIFWTLGYWQVENYLISVPAGSARHRRYGDRQAAVESRSSHEAERFGGCSATGSPQRRRILSSDRRARGAGAAARRLPLSRHAVRRSE